MEEAIRAYKLGIYFAERLGWPLQKQAGYCMGMAWVYRDTTLFERTQNLWLELREKKAEAEKADS